MTDITASLIMGTVGLFFILWGYAFLSTVIDEFYDKKNKILWLVLLIFLPVTALLFPFIGVKQMVDGNENMKRGLLITIISITVFFGFIYVFIRTIAILK